MSRNMCHWAPATIQVMKWNQHIARWWVEKDKKVINRWQIDNDGADDDEDR